MTPVCVMLRNDVSVAADIEMWRSTSQKCSQEVFAVTETRVMRFVHEVPPSSREERITEMSPPCAQVTELETSL